MMGTHSTTSDYNQIQMKDLKHLPSYMTDLNDVTVTYSSLCIQMFLNNQVKISFLRNFLRMGGDSS